MYNVCMKKSNHIFTMLRKLMRWKAFVVCCCCLFIRILTRCIVLTHNMRLLNFIDLFSKLKDEMNI